MTACAPLLSCIKHAAQLALIGCVVGTPACVGFELGPRDPLFALDALPASPAGAMLVSAVALCADRPVTSYTLQDVVEQALCNNPKTRAAWANVKAQAAQVGVARAGYLPTLSGSAQIAKNHSVSQGSSTAPFYVASDNAYHNNTLTLNWVLYDFGLRSAAVQHAEKTLSAALANQDNVLQTVFANVVNDYYAALVAQKNIAATTTMEADAKQVLRAATVRVQRGVAAISDQLQANTAYAQTVYNRNKAQGDGLSALGTLAIAMGQRPEGAIVLVDADYTATPVSALVRSVGELLHAAQQTHPALRAARAELAAARAGEKMVRAQGRATISLIGRFNANNQSQSSGVGQPYIGAATRERYIGIQVDIPFFEGFGRTYKIRNAQAQVEEKDANLSDAELQVAVYVWTSYQGLKVSAENLRTAQEIVESAQAAFEAAQSRYQKGVADILEVITTQTAQAHAQQQKIAAFAGWQNARIALAASVGSVGLSHLD
ncbi:TolC family protein [Glaciimonas sp. GG7]